MKHFYSLLAGLLLSNSLCHAGIVLDMISDEIDNASVMDAPRLDESDFKKHLDVKSFSLNPSEITFNQTTKQLRAIYKGFVITVDFAEETYGTLTYYDKIDASGNWIKKGALKEYSKATLKDKEYLLHVYEKFKIYTNDSPAQVIIIN